MYVLTMTNLYGGGGGVLYLNTSPSYPTFGKYINGSNIEIKQLVKTFFSQNGTQTEHHKTKISASL